MRVLPFGNINALAALPARKALTNNAMASPVLKQDTFSRSLRFGSGSNEPDEGAFTHLIKGPIARWEAFSSSTMHKLPPTIQRWITTAQQWADAADADEVSPEHLVMAILQLATFATRINSQHPVAAPPAARDPEGQEHLGQFLNSLNALLPVRDRQELDAASMEALLNHSYKEFYQQHFASVVAPNDNAFYQIPLSPELEGFFRKLPQAFQLSLAQRGDAEYTQLPAKEKQLSARYAMGSLMSVPKSPMDYTPEFREACQNLVDILNHAKEPSYAASLETDSQDKDDPKALVGKYKNQLDAMKKEGKVSQEQYESLRKILRDFKGANPQSSEFSVFSRRLERIFLDVPWHETADPNIDISKVKTILSEDHYGMDKVKDRIIEYMSVLSFLQERRSEGKSIQTKTPILCFVGPPGVGKTSLCRSIAKATNRSYTRLAMGGIKDETSIRGHRSTYIGAELGLIMQGMIKAKAKDPVFVLDEVDKLGKDHQGDPSAALLEVLDPEQNHKFGDHYMGIDYDLSKTMFIATANNLSTIPAPLRDRMEIIELDAYDVEEKIEIGLHHLIKKARETHGLEPHELPISTETLRTIAEKYTREPGVRNFERKILGIARKIITGSKQGKAIPEEITPQMLPELLGKKVHRPNLVEQDQTGRINGLYWSEMGGGVVPVTVNVAQEDRKGKADLYKLHHASGNMSEVFKGTIDAAMGYLHRYGQEIGVKLDTDKFYTIYIGPEDQATPIDGPSAGAAMATALISELTDLPVRGDVAMTGTISLKGKIGAIGGLKEKLLGAIEAGVHTVFISKENEPDLDDIPEKIKSKLEIHAVNHIREILPEALVGYGDFLHKFKEDQERQKQAS